MKGTGVLQCRTVQAAVFGVSAEVRVWKQLQPEEPHTPAETAKNAFSLRKTKLLSYECGEGKASISLPHTAIN